MKMARYPIFAAIWAVTACANTSDPVMFQLEPPAPCPGQSVKVSTTQLPVKGAIYLWNTPGDFTLDFWSQNLTQGGSRTQVYHGSSLVPFTVTLDPTTTKPKDQVELTYTVSLDGKPKGIGTKSINVAECK
ncbi:MAG: hypothetical protein JWM80_4801 [Cyanobacteria bacterium RYN_339]|nr:hypothetical protein [Cyanobacteria bacterium RYN_339]